MFSYFIPWIAKLLRLALNLSPFCLSPLSSFDSTYSRYSWNILFVVLIVLSLWAFFNP